MSKVKVGFATLHGPLFFASKNWGEKLDVRNTAKGRLEMEYDQDTSTLTVKCEGKETFLPHTSVFSYEGITKDPRVEPVTHASANPKIQAQVSGPHDHVFAGQGAGQTGAGKRVK
jgi:hypothetical protein